jgi:tetratricopeptide (TPR) repeat protein
VDSELRILQRGRWLELAAAAAIMGVWSVHTYIGPAIAAIHFNRYLRASVVDAELATESVEQFVAGEEVPSQGDRVLLSRLMLRHLETAAYWDPCSARIHERLADRYVTAFELQMNEGANFMDIAQIRATAAVSSFTSAGQLEEWLGRAFGSQAKLLQRALTHARRAVSLSPLQADAYLRLADLSFLELAPATVQDAYIDQVMRIRPNDRSVLTTAGRQALQNAQIEAAIALWTKCFHTPGRHQHEIVYLLVSSGMPAAEFTKRLQPDWTTLRLVWAQYKKVGDPQQLEAILLYAASLAEIQGSKAAGRPPVFIWYCLSSFYDDVGQTDAALHCLQRAYRCDPRQYSVRRALGGKLQAAGRLSEAEPHIRWCLARRPADKTLSEALVAISKARFAQRDAGKVP